jgi:hypothetical protein
MQELLKKRDILAAEADLGTAELLWHLKTTICSRYLSRLLVIA